MFFRRCRRSELKKDLWSMNSCAGSRVLECFCQKGCGLPSLPRWGPKGKCCNRIPYWFGGLFFVPLVILALFCQSLTLALHISPCFFVSLASSGFVAPAFSGLLARASSGLEASAPSGLGPSGLIPSASSGVGAFSGFAFSVLSSLLAFSCL